MQLPHLSNVDAVLVTVILGKSISAAVAALPKPSKSSGFYVWLYAFGRSEQAVITEAVDARFHLTQPGGSVTVPASLTVTDPEQKGK